MTEPVFNGAYCVYVKFEDFEPHGMDPLPEEAERILRDMKAVSDNNIKLYKVASRAAVLPPKVARMLLPFVKATFTPIKYSRQSDQQAGNAGQPVPSYWMANEG